MIYSIISASGYPLSSSSKNNHCYVSQDELLLSFIIAKPNTVFENSDQDISYTLVILPIRNGKEALCIIKKQLGETLSF